MMKDFIKPEILAPAGSMEALRAAVYAGADAVYLGGSRFGARAYADNFDGEALLDAIEYAHIYGVKVYLTINTLFRDVEIGQLYEYLLPPYEAGLDAVIVQDLGVVSYVHEFFPDLPIHASTQMTITTEYAYTLLKDYGVTRIVPARELSIEEIANLKKGAKVFSDDIPEVEVFVQGALCYCYSGQCLMSSMLGGRSGNRGRCAQTCRLMYDVVDETGKTVKAKGKHVLSPKDLCGLESITDLIGAGVDSFKIEGRMKKPEYVAACVRAYRTCVDAWFKGALTKKLIERCKQEMAEVFNRGGFTPGYYKKHNGSDMMTIENPGNVGVEIGRILDVNKNKVTIGLSKDVDAGDILVIGAKEEPVTLTCNVSGKNGGQIKLNAPRARMLNKGMAVRRMQQEKLMRELLVYSSEETKLYVTGKLVLKKDEAAKLILTTCIRGKEYTITQEGELVQQACSNPLTMEVAYSKIAASGNTRYQFEQLDTVMDDAVFYPLKALKELRRNGLENLEKHIIENSRRLVSKTVSLQDSFVCDESILESKTKGNPAIMVSTMEQHEAVLQAMEQKILRKNFADIYLDLQYFKKEDIINLVQKNKDIHYFLVLPPVLRNQNVDEVREFLKMIMEDVLTFSGVMVRNIDEFALLKWIGYKGIIITDYSLYAMNRWAVQWLLGIQDTLTVTLPVELNKEELTSLSKEIPAGQWITYGHQQLMISAQCVRNTLRGCNQAEQRLILKDRYQKSFFVSCICKYCYNLIYNGLPTVLFDVAKSPLTERVTQRLHFTLEDGEKTRSVLKQYLNDEAYEGEKTRGHYKRGVE